MQKSLYKNIIKKNVIILNYSKFFLQSCFRLKNKNPKKVRKIFITALMVIGELLISLVPVNVVTAAPTGENVIIIAQPEVWGYDLSDHELIPQGYSRSGLAYLAPDGDIVFEISRCVEHCNDPDQAKYEYAMLWFLAGKIEFIADDPTAIGYSDQHQIKSQDEYPVDLSNGECLKAIHLPTGKLCQVNDLAEHLLVKGKCTLLDDEKNIMEHNIASNKNPEIKRYSLIGAMENIYRYLDKPDGMCDRGGAGGGRTDLSAVIFNTGYYRFKRWNFHSFTRRFTYSF